MSLVKTALAEIICDQMGKIGLKKEDFSSYLGISLHEVNLLMTRVKFISYKRIEPLSTILNLETVVLSRFLCRKSETATDSKLGSLIRERRKERAMSQEMLAGKLEVKRQYISQLEHGLCCLSSLVDEKFIKSLFGILGIDMTFLHSLRLEKRLQEINRNGENPVGVMLATRRFEKKLTVKELGELAQVDMQTVMKAESGGRLKPRCLGKIAQALGIEPDQLYGVFKKAA